LQDNEFHSRLFYVLEKYASAERHDGIFWPQVKVSFVTLSLRSYGFETSNRNYPTTPCSKHGIKLLPNTSWSRATAKKRCFAAELAREALRLIGSKLENSP